MVNPKPTPLEVLLDGVRFLHRSAERALAKPQPDQNSARRYMKQAVKAGKDAAPYISDPTLRQLITNDRPMSEEHWDRLWPR